MDVHRSPAGLVVPDHALTVRFARSGGPGGQHVNTSATRVRLVCDVAACGFDPAIERRIVEVLGPMVVVVCDEERSQLRNRERAVERLLTRLDAANVRRTARRATRPTRGSVERRLDAKRRSSARKAERRRPGDD